MDEQKVTPPKPIKLKVVIRKDAVMDALKQQGEPVPKDIFMRGTNIRPDMAVVDRETGAMLAYVQDIKLDFSHGVPAVVLTILDPEIDIHLDPQLDESMWPADTDLVGAHAMSNTSAQMSSNLMVGAGLPKKAMYKPSKFKPSPVKALQPVEEVRRQLKNYLRESGMKKDVMRDQVNKLLDDDAKKVFEEALEGISDDDPQKVEVQA